MIWIVRTVSQEVFKNDLHKHSVMGYMLGPMERYQDENGPALPPKSGGLQELWGHSTPITNPHAKPSRLLAE